MSVPPDRRAFDIEDGVTYLNCAYMAPQPRCVTEVGRVSVARKARPWEIAAHDFFEHSERTRTAFAALIGGQPDEVALLPAASYGLSLAASILPVSRHSRVVVLAEQFPSNVYPWRESARRHGAQLRTVPRPGPEGWTPRVLEAVDESCSVVAVPQVHWTDGSLLDLEALGARCREVGAALVLDLTQSLGAMPLDLQAVEPDFAVCAGYKWLLGPYSTAYAWIHPRHHEAAPFEHNWIARANSEDFAGLVQYRDEYQPGARRFDVGERSNFALMPMAATALELLLDWTVPALSSRLATLTDRLAAGAQERGWSAPGPALRAPHMLGLERAGGMPEGLPERLAAERIHVSRRGQCLRVSPHVYNDEADVDRLLAALSSAG